MKIDKTTTKWIMIVTVFILVSMNNVECRKKTHSRRRNHENKINKNNAPKYQMSIMPNIINQLFKKIIGGNVDQGKTKPLDSITSDCLDKLLAHNVNEAQKTTLWSTIGNFYADNNKILSTKPFTAFLDGTNLEVEVKKEGEESKEKVNCKDKLNPLLTGKNISDPNFQGSLRSFIKNQLGEQTTAAQNTINAKMNKYATSSTSTYRGREIVDGAIYRKLNQGGKRRRKLFKRRKMIKKRFRRKI